VNPVLAVVIATHNRASYLEKALDALSAQTLPSHTFEVIVVDNASTDATREVVSGRIRASRNLRYLPEPRLGASVARNAGWQATSAPYIAFLDDDAIPAED
jgi:glycosyltransferase involved in cell wall biosynthesis